MSNGQPLSGPPVPARRPVPRRPAVAWITRVLGGLRPNQRNRLTSEGWLYLVIWGVLLAIGLYQQSNLVLLTAGLAAGPMAASILVSAAMLRRLDVTRRAPAYVFSGEPLAIDYLLANGRRSTAALALIVKDELTPVDGALPDAGRLLPLVIFPRVPAGGRGRIRWQAVSPHRGRYRFTHLELITRSPFGLWERTQTVPAPGELIVYPRVGTLARRWIQAYRESTETKRGRRHDRSSTQLDYHGLRDYRPGDSPRWLHWRTTARLGQPMIKEFEQQHDQDIAVLLDPWLPRSKVTAERREALEAVVSFAATLCLELCRRPGRRLLLGWTGPTPGLIQGTSSIRLLHEILEQLAVLRGSAAGQLSVLFDAMPAQALREAMLIVVTTRALNLPEEMDQSRRLSGAPGRSLAGRVMVLDASRGELDDLIRYDGSGSTRAAHRDWDDQPDVPAPAELLADRSATEPAGPSGRRD